MSNKCPNCGANIGINGKCHYCNTVMSSKFIEYNQLDWIVLAENLNKLSINNQQDILLAKNILEGVSRAERKIKLRVHAILQAKGYPTS